MKVFAASCFVLITVAGGRLQFAQNITFKQEVRLVEVYTTVLDHKGREVDGLTKDQFEILDEGKAQPIRVFEPTSGALSCALLLDTTASMTSALPAVRNAAAKLIDSLRPGDAVGVYAFTDHVDELQPISTDHTASKRALRRLHAGGRTALFDSVTQLAVDLARNPGKKVIIVLTDGGDNASVLNRDAAAERAKSAGVPVFAIAEGQALKEPAALSLLRDLADATGGSTYKANRSKEIVNVFDEIGQRVRNGYLLAFEASSERSGTKPWHGIQVTVKSGAQPFRVRARAGYSID